MLTELRYQAKRHAISKMPRENKSCKNSPIFFYFFIFRKKKNNKQYEKTSYAKARSKLYALNDATTEKQSLDLLFLSSPKSTCTVLSRNIGGKHN
jgi:hypothetical protein